MLSLVAVSQRKDAETQRLFVGDGFALTDAGSAGGAPDQPVGKRYPSTSLRARNAGMSIAVPGSKFLGSGSEFWGSSAVRIVFCGVKGSV